MSQMIGYGMRMPFPLPREGNLEGQERNLT